MKLHWFLMLQKIYFCNHINLFIWFQCKAIAMSSNLKKEKYPMKLIYQKMKYVGPWKFIMCMFMNSYLQFGVQFLIFVMHFNLRLLIFREILLIFRFFDVYLNSLFNIVNIFIGIAVAWMAFFVMSQDLAEIPADLTFTCEGRSYGYYADPTTNCQVFHICLGDGDIKWSFLCPNQTIFNQVLQLSCI